MQCGTLAYCAGRQNWQKLYFVADIVLKTLKKLDLRWLELVTEKFKPGIKTK